MEDPRKENVGGGSRKRRRTEPSDGDSSSGSENREKAGGRNTSPLENFWESHHDILLLEILTFLDVVNLVQAKGVCHQLQRMATKAIEQKCDNNPQAFENGVELRIAVRKYIKTVENPKDAESIARTYGWPIGKWDVSQVTYFSWVFNPVSYTHLTLPTKA